jgi:hypothetical protein
MGDRVIFIGWSNPVRGREQASTGVFADAMDFWGRLKAAGEIESFEAVLLDYHGGDLGGFFLLRGEAEKLARVSASPEMRQMMLRANLIVDGLGAVGGVVGDAVSRQMGMFLEASKTLG